jgi:sulfotransferase
MKTYFFISGLPRSGSTLVSSILRQNPKFYADISSPLEILVNQTITTLTNNENNYNINENQRISIIRHLFEGYYSHLEQPIIFDTSRSWTKRTTLLQLLFPYTKIICCVRDIVQIINSFEVIFKKNPLYANTIIKSDLVDHVFSRCDAMMDHKDGIITANWLYLQEAFYANPEMIYFVNYEELCKFPEETMSKVYSFINEPYFNHDYNNLNYSNKNFDNFCNLKDLHTVKSRVEYTPPRLIIPPEIVHKYSSASMEFWKNINNNPVNTLLSYK